MKARAVEFVDLLIPGSFLVAKSWLSADCEYVYLDKVLKGDAIIESFEVNHENAAKRLDRILYLRGEVEEVIGQSVSVLVTDQIWSGKRMHVYQDRLIVTLEERSGKTLVTRIENRRVEGEREKLMKFYEACGI